MLGLNPAQAYWNQRHALSADREKILRLIQAVDWVNDLSRYQWAQLIAFTLEFEPDLILELGRGRGNSTCAFTHVANHLDEKCRVTSICLSRGWDELTKPRLERIVSPEWFGPLEIVRGDILTYDYETLLADARRVFLFWDAHGFEVAECVLGRVLPIIQSKGHVVVMHDLADTRYSGPEVNSYQHRKFWRGQAYDRAPLRIGNIVSWVEQSVAIVDFTSRNGIALDSADHSFHTMFDGDVQKRAEMASTLGDFFDTQAHWFWFSLEGKRDLTFPLFIPPQPEMLVEQPAALPLDSRPVADVPALELLKVAGRRLLGRAKKVLTA